MREDNMKKIEYIDDCILLQKVALSLGYAPTLYQIEIAWDDISEESCAGWLDPSSYDKVWLKEQLEKHLSRI